MAEFVLKDAYFLVDGRDFAPQFNSVTFNYQTELQDRTAISDGTRKRVAGLLDFDGSLEGFWAETTASTGAAGYANGSYPADVEFDSTFFNKVGPDAGNSNFAIGISQTTGDVSFFGSGIHGTYDIGGSIGELMGVNISFQGSGNQPLIRGEVALSGYSTAATVNGPGIDYGAIPAGQDFYAAAFVLGSSGGTADVTLVSSSSHTDFTLETTRATFTQFTSTGSELVTVAGPITDTAWRIKVAQGSSPAFNLLVSVGSK